ncbi:MAG: PA14 domain-containing protein [Planctomycetota bacterium]|nr:PA14 domain-containing protein [Planctomycetota bacterium]
MLRASLPVHALHGAMLWLVLMGLLGACREPASESSGTREIIDLSGGGWSLSLDPAAEWESDTLHLPGVELSSLSVHAPTDGWDALNTKARAVSVPGTVEGIFWDELGGDYKGVSYWSRLFQIAPLREGQRAVLCFDAVRLRAEVFVGGVEPGSEKLVGYDAVGNVPFEVDVTEACRAGGERRLVVRVTDPGGNFDWRDYNAHAWGEQPIPASHGFGGITGPVRLEVRDALYVEDVFVKNTPSLSELNVEVMLGGENAPHTGETIPSVHLEITADGQPDEVLIEHTALSLPVEEGFFGPTVSIPLPLRDGALQPWTPETPALYRCRISLPDGDALSVRFGLRWFAPDGIGEDAVFRLNGKRVVLRSAISWGFWPVTGLVPTPELAKRQVESAKALGLNMLNHHRTLAAPGLLDVHDELGLLAYEEPGGYWAKGGDELAFAFARAKWLRMIRRDRNHPSLVIFNMINESSDLPDARIERDLVDAQRLDPTRIITYTSAWSADDDPALSLHARPGETELLSSGWWDQHNAPGPGVDRDEHWKGAEDYLRRSENRQDIVFWGEDGAIATQPRLALIANEVATGQRGWDGTAYLEWMRAYEDYFEAKGWTEHFPDLDALTRSMGDIAYTYQATVISNIRLGDVADGYVINGWDGSRFENHSGVVDAWRNPKGSEALLARANAPLVLEVKLRDRVMHVGTDHGKGVVSPAVVEGDVALINEVGLVGPHELRLFVLDPGGVEQRSTSRDVTVTGGEVFGEILFENMRALIDGGPGKYRVRAELWPAENPGGTPVVAGEAEVLLVDWRSRPVPEGGALLSTAGRLGYFLNTARKAGVPEFEPGMPPLRWVAADHFDPEPMVLVPAEVLGTATGEAGLMGAYYDGADFDRLVFERLDESIDFKFPREGPHAELGGTFFSVRWTGSLTPPESGIYRFHTESSGGVRLWVDGELLLDEWTEHGPQRDASRSISLTEGQPVDVRLDFFQEEENARVRLLWTTPDASSRGRALITDLAQRVAEDGTTLLLLDHTAAWARLLSDAGHLNYEGLLPMGRYWLGGNHFVRDHPLFEGLPVGGALSVEYQDLVNYGAPSYGLLLEGEDAVAACITGHTPQLATTVGVVSLGKGEIVLSTLDIPRAIPGPPGSHDVPKLLLMNFLEYTGQGR